MAQINDQEYLRNKQYKDASNLNARINLHNQFSINPGNWFHWLFDHYQFPSKARILEVGCGPGDLWRENLHRIRDDWQITLSDFSDGMLEQTRANLAESSCNFEFEVIDAQEIPYPDETFDAVIANFMLYHVPDRTKALEEISRVLVKGERLYAATIGDNHMGELPDLVLGFDSSSSRQTFDEVDSFSLESGRSQLEAVFPQVELTCYEDGLRITEAEPLVDYVLSGLRWGIKADRRQELLDYVQAVMDANEGVISITKATGLFTAIKAR